MAGVDNILDGEEMRVWREWGGEEQRPQLLTY